MRKPNALPSDQYQVQLNRFLGAMCHRNSAAGWKRDKTVRDSGPFTARLVDGKWGGTYAGTHSPRLIWYSPDMIEWLRANRPADPAKTPVSPAPITDGAIMIKELYSPRCRHSHRYFADKPTVIRTVRGIGYMFVPPAE